MARSRTRLGLEGRELAYSIPGEASDFNQRERRSRVRMQGLRAFTGMDAPSIRPARTFIAWGTRLPLRICIAVCLSILAVPPLPPGQSRASDGASAVQDRLTGPLSGEPGDAATGAEDAADTKRYVQAKPRLGSLVTIIVYAPDQATAERVLKAAYARVDRLDGTLSDYRDDSELSRLGRSAPHERFVALSDDLGAVLWRAKQIHRESDGAFDATLGQLTRLWRRARRRKQLPDETQLQKALAQSGDQLLTIERRRRELPEVGWAYHAKISKDGVRLDLGGIAKGYIVDETLQVIQKMGVQSALVNAGGDIGVLGRPPGKAGWGVAVASLEAKGKPDRVITLEKGAVATSGDAFQAVEIEGVRYSHILDPKTGIGLTRRSSVTVIAPTAMEADAWASAISVLGAERGLPMLRKSLGAEQVHARVLTMDDQGRLTMRQTPDFPAGEPLP